MTALKITPANDNIIALASGKGGVGKTFLAVSIAHALANQGKKILLFDGDFGLANVDIQLGLTPKFDISSVLMGKRALNQVVTHDAATGLDIITGRSGAGSLINLPIEKLQLVRDDLMILAKHYDAVVIDLGSGLEKSVQLFAASAGTVYVVCTDEPTSLTDSYAFIKTLRDVNKKADIRIIVNNADSEKEGMRTYETLKKACENFIEFSPPLAGVVRRDTRVKDAVRSQSALMAKHPDSDAARDVKKIINDK